jgi:ketosteroid isomerase-like protein
MTEAHRRAVELAQHYFRQIAEQAGMKWDGDNDVEIEMMISYAIDAAAARLRGQLDDALERIRKLEEQHDSDIRRLWNHISSMPGGV